MPNLRVLPPSTAAVTTAPGAIHGRAYSAASGAPLDVPESDAQHLISAGWICVAPNGVGTTAQRPVNSSNLPLVKGSLYIDTTLAAVLVWDGTTWRNVITGAAA